MRFNTDLLLAELRAVSIKGRIVQGRKHPHVEWDHNGSTRKVFFSGTSVNRAAELNTRRAVRALLRQDGLLSAGETK